MKQLLTLLCGIALIFRLSFPVMASTIGVNVIQGSSLSIESQDLDSDVYKITGNIGITDELLFRAGYITEKTENKLTKTPATSLFGIRYEFQNNFAGTLEYQTNDHQDMTTVGLRSKSAFSPKMALVGKVEYSDIKLNQNSNSNSYNQYTMTAQLEYTFNGSVIGTLGFNYSDSSQKDVKATTALLAGLEFFPTEILSCWVDFRQERDSDADSVSTAGVEYKF